MANNNFTEQVITQQLAQRSGQVGIAKTGGDISFRNQLNNKALGGPTASNVLLSTPQQPNDPVLTNKALDAARGYYAGRNVPAEFVEAIASVAAYMASIRGVPVGSLLTNNSVSLDLIYAYNQFKPIGSQVGILTPQLDPVWFKNPLLRGSIAAAITNQA